LLIGFWFTRIQANKSALKALIVNRISDVALTLGIITCFCTFRDTNFSTLFALTPYFVDQSFWLFGGQFNIVNTIAILFMLGAMGKSAQIFLHT
jgi:NADH:ubiquinone oxidoreductase subunit 5 (subunit L)/multisubunit Na+/H+ antiporter MnhA subunit